MKKKYWMPEDFKMIEDVLGVKCQKENDTLVSYSGIGVNEIIHLIDLGICNAEGRQNDSPSIQQFVKFMKKNPRFRVNGYVVFPPRSNQPHG